MRYTRRSSGCWRLDACERSELFANRIRDHGEQELNLVSNTGGIEPACLRIEERRVSAYEAGVAEMEVTSTAPNIQPLWNVVLRRALLISHS